MALSARCRGSSCALGRRSMHSKGPSRPIPKLRAQQAAGSTAGNTVNIRHILEDCKALGKVRFIVIGDGAILETVNVFNNIRYNAVPGRGFFGTISTEDKSFECHINLGKVREVKFVKGKAKSGDYDTYVTRFLGEESKLILSCLVHGPEGAYAPESIKAWLSMQQKYGDAVPVEDYA